MNKLKYAALAAFMGAVATPAMADKAETAGGLKIKTDDGRFEFAIGGRIHFDTYLFEEDNGSGFGSDALENRGGAAFRRTYLTLTGKAYGWKYKFEQDFSAQGGTANTTTGAVSNSGSSGIREMWASTTIGPGELLLGQFKPFRGMEELTSSNELTMMERPVTTASGIYAGRQFLMGAGYKGILADQFGYGVDLMNLGNANTTTEGLSYGGRFYWFPMANPGSTLHLGVAYSVDREDAGSVAAAPSFTYGGRRGGAVTFGNAGSGRTGGVAGNGDQATIHLEAAGQFGPVTVQGEWATASLSDVDADNSTAGVQSPKDVDVDAYYLQASWMVTGENKPYKKDRGAFGNPKPNNAYGAWEVTARYEVMENPDESSTNALCSATVAGTFTVTPASVTECSVEQITAGVNWYVNPNVRFMLNYYVATADAGTREDKPKAASLRTQFSF